MSDGYVFDTESIIAFLYNEPGHEAVADRLYEVFTGSTNGFLTETNATELFYLIARFEGVNNRPTDASLREARRDIRALTQQGVKREAADWRLAAEIKADESISLPDAYAVALAHDCDATLVTRVNDDFDDLPVEVALSRFRDYKVR